MLHFAAAVVHRKVSVCMGYFLDNHFANTSIFSLIDLSAANIAKMEHFRFALIFSGLPCFTDSLWFHRPYFSLAKACFLPSCRHAFAHQSACCEVVKSLTLVAQAPALCGKTLSETSFQGMFLPGTHVSEVLKYGHIS